MKIWIDADACPNVVKDIIYKAAHRLKVSAFFVAHSFIKIACSDYIHFIQVEKS